MNKDEIIQRIWSQATLPEGSIAETYLKNRCLDIQNLNQYKSIRYSNSLFHIKTQKKERGLVLKIENQDGVIKGVHRIYLNKEGNKLFGDEGQLNKMSFGECAGNYIRLYKKKESMALITEGVENGLLLASFFNAEVFCSMSASNMPNLTKIPKHIKYRIIMPDPDQVGIEASNKLHNVLLKQGVYSQVMMVDQEIFGIITSQSKEDNTACLLSAFNLCKKNI